MKDQHCPSRVALDCIKSSENSRLSPSNTEICSWHCLLARNLSTLASSMSVRQSVHDKKLVTNSSTPLLLNLFGENLDVVEAGSSASRSGKKCHQCFQRQNIILFPLVDRQNSRRWWRWRWHERFLDATSSLFLLLFQKLSYVFVNTSADHNPRLGPVVLHGVDLNFNFVTFQIIRNFDFQYLLSLF